MMTMTTMTILGDWGAGDWRPGDLGPGAELWGLIAALQRQGDQCEYAQIQTSNLMIHILKKHIDKIIWSNLKRHRVEKLLKCSYCNFTSFESNQLKMHLKTHRGKKSVFPSAKANILETNSKMNYKRNGMDTKNNQYHVFHSIFGCFWYMKWLQRKHKKIMTPEFPSPLI